MTDIVERLRRDSRWTEGLTDQQIEEMCNEAADEIERLRGVEQDAAEWVEEQTKRLRAQVKRQRAALAQIMAPRYPDAWVALQDARDIARAALKEGKDG